MSKGPNSDTVGAAEFKARCLELVDRVCESRTEFIVTRHGTPVAKLVPVEPRDEVSLVGSMRGTLLRYVRPFDPVPGTWGTEEHERVDNDE